MPSSLRKVVLFEDDTDFGPDVERAIRRRLPSGFSLERFPLSRPSQAAEGPYEDRVAKMLRSRTYSNAVLLVADRDLSASGWGGLSEAAIARVGQELGLPMAWYARGSPSQERLTQVPGDGRIGLSNVPTELAHEVSIVAQGFVDLDDRLVRGKRGGRARPKSPGELLASLLGEPAAASHLDSYACGDQRVVAEFLAASTSGTQSPTPRARRRLVIALGVWIVDVVLRYPGVLLDEVAAASYLDIHPRDFAAPAVRAVFRSAMWSNAPFVDADKPRWWKLRLDDLLARNGVQLGRDLARKKVKGKRSLRYCPCHVDPSLHAGYYCMVTQKPVSQEHSVGPISWFPPGAELARITRSIFDQVGPWLGA